MTASVGLTPERQLEILRRGAVDLVRPDELLAKLRLGRPLVVKLGCDPSAPDIHLGHMVVLRKLRQFQELGHQVAFVVGDFTAQIGDPSGRSKTRPALSSEQVRSNAESYRDQVTRVLDPERTRLVYNSSWLDGLGSSGWMRLAGMMTVARMLERDDFSKRYKAGQPISIHEFLYPLAQGYDSVALEADVELGGTDQTFNLLIGRDLQREHGQPAQVILTMPLLIGLDGVEKMSKSLGNYVAITDPPGEMYGKLMSISDELMWNYYALLTDHGADGADALRARVGSGTTHPMQLKQDLARGLVGQFHGEAAGEQAQTEFERVFRDGRRPEEIAEKVLPANGQPMLLANLLAVTGLCPSAAEGRRLIAGGGVRVDGDRASDPRGQLPAEAGQTYELAVGKRRIARVRFQ